MKIGNGVDKTPNIDTPEDVKDFITEHPLCASSGLCSMAVMSKGFELGLLGLKYGLSFILAV